MADTNFSAVYKACFLSSILVFFSFWFILYFNYFIAESRKRVNESVAEEVDCKMVRVELVNGQLVSQEQIKLEPLSPVPAVTDNLLADDDEPVIGIEEFNPNYLKREPSSSSSS